MNTGRIQEVLMRPTDGRSLAVYRILFGLLMFVSATRFMTNGWIERQYGQPSFFFKYYGFEWVPVPGTSTIYIIYSLIAFSALAIAVGAFYRLAVGIFLLLFTYSQLWDVTNYLNHYYLVILLAFLLLIIPANRRWSIDAWRGATGGHSHVPAWSLYLLRFQVGCVYFYAGLAKFQSDWLLHAQPLNTWLSARSEMAVIGPIMDERWFAFLASWAGFVFDISIALWLSLRRTRAWAYVVVLGFHVYTWMLFDIGMFPFIMMINGTLFFAADWPKRLVKKAQEPAPTPAVKPGRYYKFGLSLLAIYCALQVLLPLRHYAYPGNVLWNEDGMRFSWKVMVREKHGSVTYLVDAPTLPRQMHVAPRSYLSSRQEREMAGQPDLILQLAHKIRDDFAAAGHPQVSVRVEAWVSLNGRPKQLMIDPTVDLARIESSLAPSAWVLPMPRSTPIALRPQ